MITENTPNDNRLARFREQFVASLHSLYAARNITDAEECLTQSLDHIKRTFDEFTGNPCVCTLKILNSNQKVATYLRDRQCPVDRYKADVELLQYYPQVNTAFRQLLTADSINRTHYMSNNLVAQKGYDNANPAWRDYYNACLVASVRHPVSWLEGRNQILGFICVDNLNGGFTQPAAMTLVAYAYEMFYALSAAHERMNLPRW